MLIGDLARRLRVSPRTLRHYESLGLLVPAAVDAATGYRTYGPDAVVRGVAIAQLKAAGLSLAEIEVVLAGREPLRTVLARRRDDLVADIRQRQTQLATLDTLLSQPAVAEPAVVELPETAVVARTAVCAADQLGPGVRREVQRLRRTLRREQPGGRWTFAARFPLDVDECVEVEVAALSASGAQTWAACRAVAVECVGPVDLLPLAYDAALAAAEAESRTPTGVVQETYWELGRSPRTTVAVLVR